MPSSDESSITIEIRVQPKSSRDGIDGLQNGRLKVRVSAPPEGVKANERLVDIIAKAFGVSKSSVEIVMGERSKLKTIRTRGMSQDEYDLFVKRLAI